jgi:hypothetical protein
LEPTSAADTPAGLFAQIFINAPGIRADGAAVFNNSPGRWSRRHAQRRMLREL